MSGNSHDAEKQKLTSQTAQAQETQHALDPKDSAEMVEEKQNAGEIAMDQRLEEEIHKLRGDLRRLAAAKEAGDATIAQLNEKLRITAAERESALKQVDANGEQMEHAMSTVDRLRVELTQKEFELDDARKAAEEQRQALQKTEGLFHELVKCVVLGAHENKSLQNALNGATSPLKDAFCRAQTSVCTCHDGSPNLFQAAEKGCLRCCLKHIDQAGRHDENDERKTATMKAVDNWHLEVVRFLVNKEANMRDQYDETALMIAAFSGQHEMVELLTPKEARMQDMWGETALMCAVEYEFDDCIRFLLPHEAGMKQMDGWTAFYYATMNLNRECVTALLKDKREAGQVMPQMLAAYRGDVRAMLQMRDRWAETLHHNIHGDVTILHFAAIGRSKRCAELITRGAEMQNFLAGKKLDFEDLRGDPINEICHFLPVIARQRNDAVSGYIPLLAFNREVSYTRALKPFICITPNQAMKILLSSCYSSQVMIHFAWFAKNIGFIFKDKTILDLETKFKTERVGFIACNPIYSKQIELARKQIARNTTTDENGNPQVEEIPPARQFAYHQIQLEVAFNHQLLLSSRDISWKSISSPRQLQDEITHPIKLKQRRNRHQISHAWKFLAKVVKQMLEE